MIVVKNLVICVFHLVFHDEMSIKKKIECNSNKSNFEGFVTVEDGASAESHTYLQVAKDAAKYNIYKRNT